MVLKKRLDAFHNSALDVSYHGLNKEIFICSLSLKNIISENHTCFANYWHRYSQKWYWYDFLISAEKQIGFFLKTSGCISNIKQSVIFC